MDNQGEGEVEMSVSTMVKPEPLCYLSLAVVQDQPRPFSKTASGPRPPHHGAPAEFEPMTLCSSFLLLPVGTQIIVMLMNQSSCTTAPLLCQYCAAQRI